MVELKLIRTRDYEGYESKNLKAWLKERNLDASFNEWFAGSTVALTDDGKFIIYKWDVDRFLSGLPNID